MGMYTELHFNSEIKQESEALKVLNYIFDKSDNKDSKEEFIKENNLTHKWFSSDRWDWMFFCDSYYFDADTHSTFNKGYLCIRCNLKNYTDEIEGFVDWIMPFVDKCGGDFLGFKRYEESEEPTLIHVEDLG